MPPLLKNKLLLLVCLFCLWQVAKAQSYHSFVTNDTLRWNVFINGDQSFSYIQKVMSGDTIIAHRQYKKLLGGGVLDTVFVREENKKVFFRGPSRYFKDSGEYIMYDFNLLPGDTFDYVGYGYRYEFPAHMTLLKIDTVQLDNGEYRRRFNFEASNGSQTTHKTWIGGMGDIANPVYQEDVFVGWGSNHVTCFFDGDTVLWHNEFWYPGYCNRRVSIKQQTRKVSINLFPNPATDILHIEGLPKGTSKYCYQIINMKGQIMQQGELSAGNTYLAISSLRVGTYKLIINAGNTRYATGFIKY